ncbi:MAG: hypothetical protein K2J94_10630 [Duncaniella sp.]|nr:hypothetical protein [Duncaniella sp.]
MKKIFTLVAGLFMMSNFSAYAVIVDDEASCELEHYDYDKGDYVSTGKAGVVTATINDERTAITIDNFLNSGNPVSVSFEGGKFGEKIPVTFTSPVYMSSPTSKYIYLTDAEGTRLNGSTYPADAASSVKFYQMRIYNDVDYGTYVYAYPGEDEGWYIIYLYLQGKSTPDATKWDCEDQFVTIQAYFAPSASTGIAVIEANDENAPVEFYNLNGQRVNEPANGVFIRKQGSKVEKVVIR